MAKGRAENSSRKVPRASYEKVVITPRADFQANRRTNTSRFKGWPAEGVKSRGLAALDNHIGANQGMTGERISSSPKGITLMSNPDHIRDLRKSYRFSSIDGDVQPMVAPSSKRLVQIDGD